MMTSFPPDRRKKILLILLGMLWLFIAGGLYLLYTWSAASAGRHTAMLFIGITLLALMVLFILSALATFILILSVRQKWFLPAPGSIFQEIVSVMNRWSPPYDVRPILAEPDLPDAQEEPPSHWMKDFTAEDLDEMLEFIVHRKGRGRKSYTEDDRRFQAVRDWMKMQSRGTSVRLQDFLDERFGTHLDGSPQVPKDTYYGWQRKFKKMLLDYKARKSK